MKKEETKLPLEKYTVAKLVQNKIYGGNAFTTKDPQDSTFICTNEDF